MDTKDRIQICKVIAKAIMADVQITDEEHAFLTKLMDSYELNGDQRKEVVNINFDDDPADMVEGISSMESRDALLEELLSVISVDGAIAPAEMSLVRKVGEAMGMSDEEIELVLED
jgi:uncharacterized tellurite resistance protein B-like protein